MVIVHSYVKLLEGTSVSGNLHSKWRRLSFSNLLRSSHILHHPDMRLTVLLNATSKAGELAIESPNHATHNWHQEG